MITFDPIGLINPFVNKDIAAQNRQAQYDLNNRNAMQATFFKQWDQRNIETERQRQDTALFRRVQDARRAGISPMAALGARGSSPVQISSQSAIPGQLTQTPYQDFSGIMNVQLGLNALKTLKEIKQLDPPKPSGQTEPRTEYKALKEKPVEVSSTYIEPGLESSLKYQRGPGGTRIPVTNADIEEIIGGWIIQQFGRAQTRDAPDQSGMFPHTAKSRSRRSRKWRRDNPTRR